MVQDGSHPIHPSVPTLCKENLNGPSWSPNGPSRSLNGPCGSSNGPYESLNDPGGSPIGYSGSPNDPKLDKGSFDLRVLVQTINIQM